jgi:hypothetical protein
MCGSCERCARPRSKISINDAASWQYCEVYVRTRLSYTTASLPAVWVAAPTASVDASCNKNARAASSPACRGTKVLYQQQQQQQQQQQYYVSRILSLHLLSSQYKMLELHTHPKHSILPVANTHSGAQRTEPSDPTATCMPLTYQHRFATWSIPMSSTYLQ